MSWENVALSVWVGISASGEDLVEANADIQCTVGGERRTKEENILFIFFLSCHKIWILFHKIMKLEKSNKESGEIHK